MVEAWRRAFADRNHWLGDTDAMAADALPLLQDAFWTSMAMTIMAGLTLGTALTMIVIPLFYVIFVTEYVGRLLIGLAKPIETAGTAPGAIGNMIFIPLGLVLLALSLWRRNTTA